MSDALAQLTDPTPEAVVQFLARVIDAPWPQESGAFTAHFDRLGCTAGEPLEYADPVPGSIGGPFTCDGISLETGSWAAFNGQLFSLNFFLYSGRRDSETIAEAGFEAVREHLRAVCGPPEDEGTDANGSLSAFWNPGENSIELYGHVTLAPALQVGVGRRSVEALYNEGARHADRR
ncbi:hypothetical protein H9638_14650 [Arthrobacter sp. Sa2BUA2]|uniref:Uncharacterized protein n=1 Tax=Arthrobacter pullicola TaxID=2762224 RepID=A0ABR8YLG7_9MICC|nr:hypothetical protein [Arthrobacter pullicola]MBD8045049.1 hypothetical protein [Arthrobacter pullicola]